jgi:hypothetical protein
MPKIVDLGITKLAWLPGEDAIENIAAPTVAELTPAIDYSCVMVTTYEVRADGADTTDEKAVCDVANVVTPTAANYMGNLIFFRDWDGDAQEWLASDVLNTFALGAVGFFIRRLGLPYSTAFTAGDQIEVYKFMSDNPQIQGGTGSGFLKATVPMLQQGLFDIKALVAA